MEQWHNFFFFEKEKKSLKTKIFFFQKISKFLQVYIKHKDKHKLFWTILGDIFVAHRQRERQTHTHIVLI